MSRNGLLRIFRVTHLYFGVFITPALIFFAFTGAIQSFGLHETNRDHPNYKPAHWIAVLAQIHKKQTDILPVHKPQPNADKPLAAAAPDSAEAGAHEHHGHRDGQTTGQAVPLAAPPTASTDPQPKPEASAQSPAPARARQTPAHNPIPLRIFFVIVCAGLFTSTVTGLYMSYKYVRNPRFVTLTLLAGIVIPPLLLLI